MANLYFSLPIVANGVGAAVDVSAAGAEKTIVVQGTSVGIVTIEISCDAGVSWCELHTFFGTGKKVISFAANRMRVRQSGTPSAAPFVLEVDVGANDNGGNFVVIPPPPANGTGATVNITALGSFTTLVAQGTFGGGVIGIQISENGTDFAECATFSAAGCESKNMVGDFARAVSRGAKLGIPYAPVLSMGAINDDNSDDLTVQEEGVLVGVRPILNFVGGAVTAVDDPGNNRVNVNITAAALTNLTPTQIDVGDAAAVGVATVAARGDHQHALPAPAAPVNVNAAAASAGAVTTVARADHKHDVDTGTPITVVGDTNSDGVANSLSLSDHQHRLEVQVRDHDGLESSRPTLEFVGDFSIEATDDAGNDKAVITFDVFRNDATLPSQIDVGDAGSNGAAAFAARHDHQHALPAPAAPASTAQANAAGAATTTARADHVHRTIVQSQDEGVLVSSRPTLNFVGAGVTVTDDGGGDRTVVTIPGVVDTDNALLFWGAHNIAASADTRYITTGGDQGTAPLTDDFRLPVPRSGTLRRLYVRHNAAAGNGNSVVYALLINGVATTVTVTLATGAVGQASDLVNTVAVVAGDRVSLRAVKALGIGGGNLNVEASAEIAY